MYDRVERLLATSLDLLRTCRMLEPDGPEGGMSIACSHEGAALVELISAALEACQEFRPTPIFASREGA